MSPRVSILTPTYNHERFIGQAIQSVLDQTFQDWEMLILDDASPDRTGEIVRSFSDPRIRYLPQERAGVDRLAETYNRGLSEARGELIAILEGDDYWPEYKLALQVKDFHDPEVVLSSGLFRIVSPDEREVSIAPGFQVPTEAGSNQPVGRASILNLSHKSMTFTYPVSTVMRKDALDRVGGFQSFAGLPLTDLPTFTRMGLEGRWRFRHDVLGVWRRHEQSTTGSRFPWILNAAYRFAADFCRRYRDRLPFEPGERERLSIEWGWFQAERLMLLGRRALRDGDRDKAVRCFRRARTFPINPKTHALGAAAENLARLRLSPEFCFRVARRQQLDVASKLQTGDWLIDPRQEPEDFEYLPFEG